MTDISNTKPSIAFLGLGYMGSRMARRILDAGYPLTVWNRSPDKAHTLVDAGAKLSPTAREAVADADIVISSLADDIAAWDVLLADDGALSGMKPHTVLIEMSTLSPDMQTQISEACDEREISVVDAPVAGSTPQAEAGQLVIFVGGDEEVYDHVKPLLLTMGQAAHYMGHSGSGAIMKLVVNALLGIGIQAIAEALALGEKAGLNKNVLIDTLAQTAVVSPAQKGKLENAKTGEYAPAFPLRLLYKDYGLVADLARTLSVPMPTAASSQQVCAMENARGLEEDMSAVIKLMRELSQLTEGK